jgi:hypothetical protein
VSYDYGAATITLDDNATATASTVALTLTEPGGAAAWTWFLLNQTSRADGSHNFGVTGGGNIVQGVTGSRTTIRNNSGAFEVQRNDGAVVATVSTSGRFTSADSIASGSGLFLSNTIVTVSGLPSATSGTGIRAFVSDANATTFGSIVAGGGANPVPVYSDGTNWRIG